MGRVIRTVGLAAPREGVAAQTVLDATQTPKTERYAPVAALLQASSPRSEAWHHVGMASEWSPERYERFKDERSAPFYDLVGLVEARPGMRVVDFGCGTGELTRVLHDRLTARETLGVDSSETMLARSAAFATDSLRFVREDIETFAPPQPVDSVFSNAALQWVNDHESLLPRVVSFLAPGGQLAVQVPGNDQHPSHRVAADVASEDAFRDALGGFSRVFPNLSLAGYARLLDHLGLEKVHVRRQVYLHHLESRDAVADWTHGTLLTAYLKRLPDALRQPFEQRYRDALRQALPDERPFLYPFERILFRATKPG